MVWPIGLPSSKILIGVQKAEQMGVSVKEYHVKINSPGIGLLWIGHIAPVPHLGGAS